MTKGKLYVVTMYRWGNDDSHSYVLGVFSEEEYAMERGESESVLRGRKYMPRCLELGLNETMVDGLAFRVIVPLRRSPCVTAP